jgi:low affinity Fe/Cu permease
LGGPEKIVEKLKAYAHQEFNTKDNTDLNIIKQKIENRVFSFRNREAKLETVPIDDTFPKYIRNNIARFQNLIIPY